MLAVPSILLGNALIILLVPWLADLIYALPGFPEDPLGLAGGSRTELAETGIRSIWPVGAGTELLETATLPDGQPAFQPKEINHMEDVSGLVKASLLVWLVALVAGGASGFALVKRAGRGALRAALGRGAWLTLIIMAIAGLVMLIAFDAFFDGFHSVFFEGDSWRFADGSTLRRIYPDEFWGIAFGLFAVIALVEALILAWRTTGFRWPSLRSGPQDNQ